MNTKGTCRIKICTKTTRQEFLFFCKAFSKPFFEFWLELKRIHDSSATVFQIPIGWARTSWDNVVFNVLPHEMFQIHYVDASDRLLHVIISDNSDVFENHEQVVTNLPCK
jgi:hypothetical protein